MTDRPIIFSAPMVLALLEGRKTQTRRLAWSTPWQRVRPGDRLWVREAFSESDPGVVYRADHIDADTTGWGWRPSIHCPRWASRITLTVTEVRRQRLQEIREHDARAEGTHGYRALEGIPAFRAIWSNLHGTESWGANPEVVALTFTTALRNIDAQEAR